MDWPRARLILLVAFAAVNLILAYAIWGPVGGFPEMQGTTYRQPINQVLTTLSRRGIDLLAVVPEPPGSMRFLRVEQRTTPGRLAVQGELSGGESAGTGMPAVVYRPEVGEGLLREIRMDDRVQVLQAVEEYLQGERLMPAGARLSRAYVQPGKGHIVVEYVPVFEDYPVYAGFLRVEASPRGIESVTKYWVEPRGFKEGPSKPVRPASEALLRLAGHLKPQEGDRRAITEIQLGYYAGRSVAALHAGEVSGLDTVPVWRIVLSSGDVYYVNAFNGEFES